MLPSLITRNLTGARADRPASVDITPAVSGGLAGRGLSQCPIN